MAANAATQTEEQVSLKLLVNKETDKVLFAEVEKDFVDVLFSFLTLPLGTIARLVEKDSDMGAVTVGCLNSLYHSVSDLDEECLRTVTCKEMLLQPRNSSDDYCSSLKLNIDDTEPTSTKYFMCTKFDFCTYPFLSTSMNVKCGCGNLLTRSVFLKSFHKGFVKDCTTFVITDDLIVMPNSADFTSVSLLQSSGVKSTSSLKEMTVNITREKVLDLLKRALFSKSPLTDLFLGKKPSLKRSRILSRIFSCYVENSGNIQIRLKLVVRKSDGKILYAQGEQDFANLILSFLTLPMGGVVRILGGNTSLGSIDALYKSIADLDVHKYLMSIGAKNRLVDPRLALQFKLKKQILPICGPNERYFCHYQRPSFNESIIHNEFYIANECNAMGRCKELNMPPTEGHEGYVKGLRTYVVTDDLVFAPTSPISALNLLDRLKIPLDDLKEKVITIGIKECLSILKASLTSTSALTDGLRHLLAEVKEEK